MEKKAEKIVEIIMSVDMKDRGELVDQVVDKLQKYGQFFTSKLFELVRNLLKR